jgi:hypothetical protein
MALGDGIRRNVATISPTERGALRDAFVALDTDPRFRYPDGVSLWDKQNEIHEATHVHSGPAFLPWHRELCNRLEALLRMVNPGLSLHYWDWTTNPNDPADPNRILQSSFMGNGTGDVGLPFQNPAAGVFFETTGLRNPNSPTTVPPFPIWRQVRPGAPGAQSPPLQNYRDDQTLLAVGNGLPQAQQYPAFSVALERMHNTIHGYIGGTVGGDPHHAFHDPLVFLLHSNVDRLWAMWQLAAGQTWRLDPELIYGDDTNRTNLGLDPFGSGKPIEAIKDKLQPWAGGDANHPPVRPWTPADGEILVKDATDSSVVRPPRYDTASAEELHTVSLTDDGGMWHTIRHSSSWQPEFGDVKSVESNDPGYFSAVAGAGVNGELQLSSLTNDGKMWHTIRHPNLSWQPFFGDVKGVESNDPGYFTWIGSAGVNGELQLVGLTDDGGMWHTIRHPNLSWQPFFGDVKGVESNNPGHFRSVACAGVDGGRSGGQELHVVAVTNDGKLWHTIRRADGSWQPFFGDVKSVESNDPGHFCAVGCAGVGGDLHVVVLTDIGGMWHTIRHSSSWQPFFGDVKSVESNDPGHFSAVSCGNVDGELHVAAVTNVGGMWHTIRHPDGSWQPSFGDVKSVEKNDPGYFTLVGCAGV